MFEAARDGVLLEQDGQLKVVDLIVVDGDVDYATGNQDAVGAVQVTGCVREGFRVSATSDVTVEGDVEAGTVECGGRLVVKGAAVGGPDASLSGARGVRLHHAQNARVRSDGDVVFEDSDSGSEVVCQGRIEAREGRGLLRGGVYGAARGVRAKELGSPLGAPTRFTVGLEAVLGRELKSLELALAELQRVSRKARRATGGEKRLRSTSHLSAAANAAVRRAVKARREAVGTEAALRERRRRLEKQLAANGPVTVEVEGTAHPGVELRIERARMVLHEAASHVRFELDADGEITFRPMNP